VRKAMTFHLASRVEEVLEFALERRAESAGPAVSKTQAA